MTDPKPKQLPSERILDIASERAKAMYMLSYRVEPVDIVSYLDECSGKDVASTPAETGERRCRECGSTEADCLDSVEQNNTPRCCQGCDHSTDTLDGLRRERDKAHEDCEGHEETIASLRGALAAEQRARSDEFDGYAKVIGDRDATLSDLRAKLDETKEKLTWSQVNRDGMWLDSFNRACGTAFNDKESAVMHVTAERQRRGEAELAAKENAQRAVDAINEARTLRADLAQAISDRDDCARELERVSAVAEEMRIARDDLDRAVIRYREEQAALRAKCEGLEAELETTAKGERIWKARALEPTQGDGLRNAVEQLANSWSETPWHNAGTLLHQLLAAHPAPTRGVVGVDVASGTDETRETVWVLASDYQTLQARIDKAVGILQDHNRSSHQANLDAQFALLYTPPAEPKRDDFEKRIHVDAPGVRAGRSVRTAEPKRYIPWANAGGPNECKHGYAAGIPCPDCYREKAAEPKREAGEVCERCKAFGHTTPCIGCHAGKLTNGGGG